MENKKLMVDTTTLIEHFRKTEKERSTLLDHIIKYHPIHISCITEFEVMEGATPEQFDYWNYFFQGFIILPFDSKTARKAAEIKQLLKKQRKSIEKADLFIAATAITHGLTLDTANRKHFEHVNGLDLFEESAEKIIARIKQPTPERYIEPF